MREPIFWKIIKIYKRDWNQAPLGLFYSDEWWLVKYMHVVFSVHFTLTTNSDLGFHSDDTIMSQITKTCLQSALYNVADYWPLSILIINLSSKFPTCNFKAMLSNNAEHKTPKMKESMLISGVQKLIGAHWPDMVTLCLPQLDWDNLRGLRDLPVVSHG